MEIVLKKKIGGEREVRKYSSLINDLARIRDDKEQYNEFRVIADALLYIITHLPSDKK